MCVGSHFSCPFFTSDEFIVRLPVDKCSKAVFVKETPKDGLLRAKNQDPLVAELQRERIKADTSSARKISPSGSAAK